MGFSRQEYWCGLPFPSPGDLPDPGIESGPPALQADSLPSEPLGKPNPILASSGESGSFFLKFLQYIWSLLLRWSISLLYLRWQAMSTASCLTLSSIWPLRDGHLLSSTGYFMVASMWKIPWQVTQYTNYRKPHAPVFLLTYINDTSGLGQRNTRHHSPLTTVYWVSLFTDERSSVPSSPAKALTCRTVLMDFKPKHFQWPA